VVGGVGVGGERLDDEQVFDDAVETVGDASEEAGGGADKPAERAGFVVAGIGGFLFLFGGLSVLSVGVAGFRLRLFGSCGVAGGGGWVGKNRGGKDGKA